jgi:hypothetical protein
MIAAFGTTEIFTTGASTRLALSIWVARKARRIAVGTTAALKTIRTLGSFRLGGW